MSTIINLTKKDVFLKGITFPRIENEATFEVKMTEEGWNILEAVAKGWTFTKRAWVKAGFPSHILDLKWTNTSPKIKHDSKNPLLGKKIHD